MLASGVIAGAVCIAGIFWYIRNQDSNRPTGANGPVVATSRAVGFVPEQVDLGKQTWGGEAAFQLEFVNPTAKAVTIKNLNSSCDCTLIDTSRFVGVDVPPGGRLTIDGTLRVGRQPGRLLREVVVQLDDGARVKGRITLDAVATYAINEAVVDFGSVPLQGAGEITDSVRFQGDGLLLLGQPQVSSRWMRARYSEDAPGITRLLVVLLPERLAAGLNTGTIQVTTSDRAVPVQVITVKAVGAQPLRAVPSMLLLKPGQEQDVAFIDLHGERAAIVSAECDVPAVSVVIRDGGVELRNAGGLTGSAQVRVKDSEGQWGTVLVHAP